jgi:hypothetical protein
MLTPKWLLFLAEVPRESWPDGAEELRDAAVAALRDKEVYRCLPGKSREFFELVWSAPAAERSGMRDRYVSENAPFEYVDKPGWLRFGFPLSYNSDALEALAALRAVREPPRAEYAAALAYFAAVTEFSSDDVEGARERLDGMVKQFPAAEQAGEHGGFCLPTLYHDTALFVIERDDY